MIRLIGRFVLPLALVLAAIGYGVVPLVDSLTMRWSIRDLDGRAALLANAMRDRLEGLVANSGAEAVSDFLERATKDERLFAVGYCDGSGHPRFRTRTFPYGMGCFPDEVEPGTHSYVRREQGGLLHVSHQQLSFERQPVASLVLVHDMSFLERRSQETTKYIFYLFTAIAAAVSVLTVLIAHFSQQGLVRGMRALLQGEGIMTPLARIRSPELRPLARELRALVKDLEQDRRVRDESRMTWAPRTLKTILQQELAGEEVLIVSNREPYIHVKNAGRIEVRVPASGLVSALEPVMRACSGTWIAHGAGSADRETVDADDRVQVPPNEPAYQLRRVWLTTEEEEGYYYGFANEGLWPLCHFAHNRPTFRSEDWNQYRAVNQKFADAVVREAKTDDPVILVQDYHFALLPKMVREKLPNATIITFWHIPWPNPEAFGICPWREEILEGMLGSSILGFHTRFHCNNFIDTVDRYLEARVDREASGISMGGVTTSVQSYPISIEWPPRWLKTQAPIGDCRRAVRARNEMDSARLLGVGVDRLDYTKGILERFLSVERLFELHPEWIGRFTLVQIAAPSRSSIQQYQNFEAEVRALGARINQRFGSSGYDPICLLIQHHEPPEVFEYFRGSDVCLVTSLHDGMNLVAKEFVASREDERGVLVLSQFTGAARELSEALVVNPYDIDQCAAALHAALIMSADEQRDRMRSMRALVEEYNVYRWAGRMLMDAARIRRQERLRERIRRLDPLAGRGWRE